MTDGELPNDKPDEGKEICVWLTPYDWHCLLRELEFCMSIYGRENPSVRLYESIASQLSDVPVAVRTPEPEPKTEAPPAGKTKNIFERLFGK